MAKRKPKKPGGIKLACQLFQLYVRLRDTDVNGYGRCSSCGMVLPWSRLQGGHWHPKTRAYNAACLMEQNCNIQCVTCNLGRQGNVAAYTEFMLATYGEDVIGEITQRSKQILDKSFVQDEIVRLHTLCVTTAKTKNFPVRIPKC